MRKSNADKALPDKPDSDLGQLDIMELTEHSIESEGREEVNQLLQSGWILLHICTQKYLENDVWRERPMAILGYPRSKTQKTNLA